MLSAVDHLQPDVPFFVPPRPRTPTPFSCNTPDGWTAHIGPEWSAYLPPSGPPAAQGWKVHVSAAPDDAESTLSLVAEIATRHGVPFKHLTTRERFFRRNSKLCPREHAGKFIALYPDPEALGPVLERLEAALAGRRGPYVLSDRRWAQAPVFLRFGVFRPHPGGDGSSSVDLVAPDGTAQTDGRGVRFDVPSWAPVPDAIKDWLARTTAAPTDGSTLPFTVEEAIRFSNAGGVYRGTVRGNAAVIKEARPGAGLDPLMRDAVTRLTREHDALLDLAGIPGVPTVLHWGREWEHHFLAQSFVPGVPLARWACARGLYYATEPGVTLEFVRSCHVVLSRLRDLVDAVHDRGWCHMDLHPGNVLVDPDTLAVGLVDYENCERADGPDLRHAMAAPGFGLDGVHPPRRHDAHGLRQIGSFLLWPGVVPSALHPDHVDGVVAAFRRSCPYPGLDPTSGPVARLLDLVAELSARARPEARRSVDAVALDATGDVHTRTHPPADTPAAATLVRPLPTVPRDEVPGLLRSGLAIARDLAATDERRYPVHHRALRHGWRGLGYGDLAVARLAGHDPAGLPGPVLRPDAPRGLWTGAAGDVLASGPSGGAASLTDEQLDHLLATPGTRVFDGLPGVLLALGRSPAATPHGERIADAVRRVAADYLDDPGRWAPRGRAHRNRGNSPLAQDSGLLYGHLGLAWLFTDHVATGGGRVADALVLALREELAGYVDTGHGALLLDQGTRTLPYLATGSAGWGVVLPAVPDDLVPADVAEAVPGLLRATEATTCVFPGLFNGYAGLQLGRAGLRAHLGHDRPHGTARESLLDTLGLFALGLGDGGAVCGDEGGRLTCDVATGGAGILLVAAALEAGHTDPLAALVGGSR